MDRYDAVVVGGGIGGSVAARFLATGGSKTLLIEKFKTPRDKPCSGIQFPYLEKLVGAKIPRERLCQNELFRVEMITPDGQVLQGRMKMLNFWRSAFDSWLNELAINAGADFWDESRLLDFCEDGDWLTVEIGGKNGRRKVMTRYLLGADGLSSTVRRKLRPQDFSNRKAGAAINYYFVGDAEPQHALHVFRQAVRTCHVCLGLPQG
jgi:flavin-dependent dehydrogenase